MLIVNGDLKEADMTYFKKPYNCVADRDHETLHKTSTGAAGSLDKYSS